MSELSAPAIRRRNGEISTALQGASLPPILKKVYANRGIQHPDELVLTLNQLLPPHSLGGIQDAAELLADAIEGEGGEQYISQLLHQQEFQCRYRICISRRSRR